VHLPTELSQMSDETVANDAARSDYQC
jgi:hypothetical protein